MFSDLNFLPAKGRERLENSLVDTFFREFFMRLDEDIFAVLCSQEASRSNVPVNVFVGLETLKAGTRDTEQPTGKTTTGNPARRAKRAAA